MAKPKVHGFQMGARDLLATDVLSPPESPFPPGFMQDLLDYQNSPAQDYIRIAMAEIGGGVDSDWTEPGWLRRMIEAGRAAFEADLAELGVVYVTERAAYDDPPARADLHASVVYYMRMDRLVKIGSSGRLALRRRNINPQGVLAVEWGDRTVERARHRQFADLHSHGEWFHLRDELLDHVVRVRDEFADMVGMSTEKWLIRVGVRA